MAALEPAFVLGSLKCLVEVFGVVVLDHFVLESTNEHDGFVVGDFTDYGEHIELVDVAVCFLYDLLFYETVNTREETTNQAVWNVFSVASGRLIADLLQIAEGGVSYDDSCLATQKSTDCSHTTAPNNQCISLAC